jgi:hypothetical protein
MKHEIAKPNLITPLGMGRIHDASLQKRVAVIASEIDDLSKPENLGVWGLKHSLRQFGYDVDADAAVLGCRSVDA